MADGEVLTQGWRGCGWAVAYLYGRSYIRIDTEEEYLELSIKRFEELRKNLKRRGRQKNLARLIFDRKRIVKRYHPIA